MGVSERDYDLAGRRRWESQNETVAQLVGEGGSLQMRFWLGRWEPQNKTTPQLVGEGGSLRMRLWPAGRGRWESPNETMASW